MSAEALAAKVLSDADFAKKVNGIKSESEFQSLIAQYGYKNISTADFANAVKAAAEKAPLSDEAMEQVGGGLSMVGVDYAFTVAWITTH